MEFSANHPLIFVLVGLIIATVLAQSVYFLVRAWRRARERGMDMKALRKTVTTSALFTIAPAVAIVLAVITLSRGLGLALPWLRLSVIGSQTYETIAAESTLRELGKTLSELISDPSEFVTVAFVMTLGILVGLVMVPLFTKKIQGGMMKIGGGDKKWGEIFNNALFLGMISAFLGFVFCDVLDVAVADYRGLIPVCVMAVSALAMALLGGLAIALKQRWLTDYALPLSLIAGMAAAIPLTEWLTAASTLPVA